MENKTPQPPRKCPICDGKKFTRGTFTPNVGAYRFQFAISLIKSKTVTGWMCDECGYLLMTVER